MTLVNRTDILLKAKPEKVIINLLNYGDPGTSKRIRAILDRIMQLSEEEVEQALRQCLAKFEHRHRYFRDFAHLHFDMISPAIKDVSAVTESRRLFIGTCFTKEYSICCAARFNPSIVRHPNQNNLPEGSVRAVMTLRAVGEGHISSIEFKEVVIDENARIVFEPYEEYVTTAIIDANQRYTKEECLPWFTSKPHFAKEALALLPETFDKQAFCALKAEIIAKSSPEVFEDMLDCLESNYNITSFKETPLSENVIFPSAKEESMGMEDVRMVEFDDDGEHFYLGTYTAYNGQMTWPKLFMTSDFKTFQIRSFTGEAINGKGLALFPEKIGGKFAMLGRQGGEDITLMYSNDLLVWDSYEVLVEPSRIWSLVQLGNCGSPLKTSEGWLVITHGVGPMREYGLGALLLDLDNPARVIKELEMPLLLPDENEREGYVPNVVYSCGAMVHGKHLIIPYAISDSASTFATVVLQDLLNEMKPVL